MRKKNKLPKRKAYEAHMRRQELKILTGVLRAMFQKACEEYMAKLLAWMAYDPLRDLPEHDK